MKLVNIEKPCGLEDVGPEGVKIQARYVCIGSLDLKRAIDAGVVDKKFDATNMEQVVEVLKLKYDLPETGELEELPRVRNAVEFKLITEDLELTHDGFWGIEKLPERGK